MEALAALSLISVALLLLIISLSTEFWAEGHRILVGQLFFLTFVDEYRSRYRLRYVRKRNRYNLIDLLTYLRCTTWKLK